MLSHYYLMLHYLITNNFSIIQSKQFYLREKNRLPLPDEDDDIPLPLDVPLLPDVPLPISKNFSIIQNKKFCLRENIRLPLPDDDDELPPKQISQRIKLCIQR